MSDTIESLRRKIDSASDLQSVVRTMKTLAASSIGQYQQSVSALADYYRTVELGLSTRLRAIPPPVYSPTARTSSNTAVVGAVVFGSDQGLVGRFNEVIAGHAIRTLGELPGTPQVWAVGERVHAQLADAGLTPLGCFSVPASVQAITPLVGQILLANEARHGETPAGELHLCYNRTSAAAAYTPVSQRLLPLDQHWQSRLARLPWPTHNLPEVLGDSTVTLRALIREYLFVSLFRACAESLASENASRLAAMQRADNNIGELLEQLYGAFHLLRQSGIDEELFDVIAGFEALSMSQKL